MGTTQSAGTLTQPRNLFFGKQSRPERVLERNRHAGRCFAGADDGDVADFGEIDFFVADEKRVACDLDVLGNQTIGQHRMDAGPPDALDVGAELGGSARHTF